VALFEYYLQVKELYEDRVREVNKAAWRDHFDESGLRRRMKTMLNGFLCPSLRSLAVMHHAMDLRRCAPAGE
jgi:hypothetical protein